MKKKKPLVSVVTPCFNSSDYLKGCIKSILSQDYPNVEHVIHDSTSADGTLDILKHYNKKVRWVSKRDKGQSDGLNRALQRAKGDIIIVLNADDELLPHACSWAVKQFKKYPNMAVIYGDVNIIDSHGKAIEKFHGPDPYNFEKIFCVEEVIPAQAAFIKRKAFEAVGFYADTTQPTCPDYEMWVRIGLKFPMKHVPGFVTRYRRHTGSGSCQNSLVYELIRTKRNVIKRTIKNKSTPDSILKLKRRAHAGVI
ncbi:glycosyltransferase family 2 protein, partial [Nanoarchaeota archaeon]